MLYEGGTCTCDLIERVGPPSEREDPYWDNHPPTALATPTGPRAS